MSTTRKLRLGPLLKTESVNGTFSCPASLKADLDRYAALHAQGVWRGRRCGNADPAHAGGLHRRGSRILERNDGQGDATAATLTMRMYPLPPTVTKAQPKGCAFVLGHERHRQGYDEAAPLLAAVPLGFPPRSAYVAPGSKKRQELAEAEIWPNLLPRKTFHRKEFVSFRKDGSGVPVYENTMQYALRRG